MATPSLTYVICTGPRTGSSLLAEGLDATGRAGRPFEYFDATPANVQFWLDRFHSRDDVEFVEKTIDWATTPNGVCGVKLHWNQTESMRAKLAKASGDSAKSDVPLADLLKATFTDVRYLWLRRRNKVAQGVSYYLADRTGKWHSFEKPLASPPDFDFAAIDQLVARCVGFDKEWENLFRRHRIAPLVLVYEEFVRSYGATIRGILQFLGISDVGLQLPPPRLERMASERSVEWERRYREIKERSNGRPVPKLVQSVPAPTATASAAVAPAPVLRATGASRPISLAYLICTEPRTGSTLLADALTRTGIAGRPEEYFGEPGGHHDAYWMRRVGARNEAEHVDRVIAAATTDNGVFGVKVHWPQVDGLRRRLAQTADGPMAIAEDASLDAALRARLGTPRYVWLRRKNKVAQAISYYRAAHTGVWSSAKGRSDQAVAPDRALAFDFAAIDRCFVMLREYDWQWNNYFRSHRLAPLMIAYEDLVANLDLTVRGILQFLGVAHAGITVPEPVTERQADERSLEWERKYREIKGAQAGARTTTAVPVRPASVAAPAAKRAVRKNKAAVQREGALPLVAYAVAPAVSTPLVVAPVARDWMDATAHRFAYRCLPMLIANQAGWLVLNPYKVAATWDGRAGLDAVRVEFFDAAATRSSASSHFGFGILTFGIPYLFRTPPGYNLLARGPANWPKDGIYPLDGIIETDWSEATFTMNWKFTRSGQTVVFEEGEPICMVVPQRRNELERFRPEIRDIASDPALADGHHQWRVSRAAFNQDLTRPDSPARKAGWQRHYLRGTTVTSKQAPEHQSRLALEDFVDKRTSRRLTT